MDDLSSFLVGGPAYSGTTLLALLLNEPGSVCLDEPDFQKQSHSHRGIPVLQRLFPDVEFPAPPGRDLTYAEAFDLFEKCSAAIHPTALGFKTCNWDFVGFARLFSEAGLPVVLIIRDIRDALLGFLPRWVTEQSLNAAYRKVWENRALARVCVRYEDLVRAPAATLAKIKAILGPPFTSHGSSEISWDPAEVPKEMFKDKHHDLLRVGAISRARAGLWRRSTCSWSPVTIETARIMGYET